MPTYEYECAKCGHSFEAFQSMSAPALESCPRCKGKLKRLIGGGLGVIFKGSGFYTTDNKRSSTLTSGNGSKEGSKDGSKDGGKGKGDTGKGDSGKGDKSAAATAPDKKPVS